MKERQDIIEFCLKFGDTYEDYPFEDKNWTVMKCRGNKKWFAVLYNREGELWMNVKCDPEWRDFWRNAYEAVIPAYHMNKTHWNTVILNGTVPVKDVERMIRESYELVKPKQKKTGKSLGI